MLLETLDVKKNDVIIYSQNLFNIEKNFKIIFKDDPERLARKINYSDVCRFVNQYVPKNLIVYRLLTNIRDFKMQLSRYGFLLNINGNTELIYFDPVFAVKELEEYNELENLQNLRFRIQQVGLTTLNRKGNLPNYAEIYNVDLEAMEAKFQNDKVFAEAIVSLGTSPRDLRKGEIRNREAKPEGSGNIAVPGQKEKSFAEKIKNPGNIEPKEKLQESVEQEGYKLISHDVAEDKDFDYAQILRMNSRPKTIADPSEKTTTQERLIEEKKKSDFSNFLKKNVSEKEKISTKEKTDFVDIFKTPTPLKEFITKKENQRIVLKLSKKK
ncbi:MAG TPA: hypothetical protein VJ954_00660 [Ignavibacteriaceae bacterium]|nr:hypothetical protein [Ignavibacteriaceae bacterium]